MYLLVLMVHNWFKTILNQLCTIGTNKYMYHKWKNHTAIENPPVKRKKLWRCVGKTYLMVLMLCNKNHFLKMVLMVHNWFKTILSQLFTIYLLVLMVHNWFKTILNQLCTIGTNKYMYHKWKNHTAIENPPVKRKKLWRCVGKT